MVAAAMARAVSSSSRAKVWLNARARGVVDPSGQQRLVDDGESVEEGFAEVEHLVGRPVGDGQGEGDLVGGELVGPARG